MKSAFLAGRVSEELGPDLLDHISGGHGSQIDPNGSTSDAGSQMDPNGARDEGSSMDPNGRTRT
jgi:hypothetical protein